MSNINDLGFNPAGKSRKRVSIPRGFFRTEPGIELAVKPFLAAFYFSSCLHAAENLTGGRINGCKDWSDIQWLMAGIVGASHRNEETKLWSWEGADLILHAYDHEGDVKYMRQSEGGRSGGIKSRKPRPSPHKRKPPDPHEKGPGGQGNEMGGSPPSPSGEGTLQRTSPESTLNGHDPDEINKDFEFPTNR